MNGKVKTNTVGYKDILAEARKLYPAADQVIDIVVDYETKEIDTDYSLLMTDKESDSSSAQLPTPDLRSISTDFRS